MHHIPGTPVDVRTIPPYNSGGPGVCEDCSFEIKWYNDFDRKRAELFPSEVSVRNLDSHTLRNISAKLRSQNPKPNTRMLVREYQLSRSIFALADAFDGVADDIDGL